MIREMVKEAFGALKYSYSPYSHFKVAAALLTKSGKIYTGCNIENAAYSPSNCAERTAVFKAVSDGKHKIQAMAVAGGMEGGDPADYAYPCGICRQVIQEFAAEDMVLIVAKSDADYREFLFKELLPCGFGGESIQ